MVSPVVFIAALPLLFRLAPLLIPAGYLEPYAYWKAQTLNSEVNGRVPHWRNMGWWENGSNYSTANEALARRLLEFSGSPGTGNVLDVAHGAGESLLLHLDRHPDNLDALTSIPHETTQAKRLVEAHGTGETNVQWFTSSASLLPGKDLQHPLNPMRGFMGERKTLTEIPSGDGEDVPHQESPSTLPAEGSGPPPPYDLIYILDAIYHFPPSVEHYLRSVLPVLRPGKGIVTFTDIIPPSNLSPVLAGMIYPLLLSVPPKNLARRPASAEEYRRFVEYVGFENVKVEDWTENVFPGLAKNLSQRGGLWKYVGQAIDAAHKNGWKFVAVRAQRPLPSTPDNA